MYGNDIPFGQPDDAGAGKGEEGVGRGEEGTTGGKAKDSLRLGSLWTWITHS